jgi:hypothetical protein
VKREEGNIPTFVHDRCAAQRFDLPLREAGGGQRKEWREGKEREEKRWVMFFIVER